MRRRNVLLLGIAALLATSGCSMMGGSSVTLESSKEFDNAVSSYWNSAPTQPTRLSDFTTFEWDKVAYAFEGTSREKLQDLFGDPIIKQKYYDSAPNLFVFSKNGSIVKALMVTPDLFAKQSAGQWFEHSVTVQRNAAGFLELNPAG